MKPGDLVTTAYYPAEANIIRRITNVIHDRRCKSGLLAGADGGGVCGECGKQRGKAVPMIDSEHYKILKNKP